MAEVTALSERIAEQRVGGGDPRAMLGEFRRALVLVPLEGGGLWTAKFGGVRWVCGFTDEAALARFAQTRGSLRDAGAAGRSWEFAELRGARLLDEIIPAMEVPAGVAMNIADADGSMFFPPVVGIVPDTVAVGREAAEGPEVVSDHGGGRDR
ncbi:hypothetical protein [Streptomyces sp. NPDC088115]|uniref:hypothetical protein n=1 Tax=Streptomyces sp. NPDC088115 TaxID=3365824 RepID=UPI0037FE366A